MPPCRGHFKQTAGALLVPAHSEEQPVAVRGDALHADRRLGKSTQGRMGVGNLQTPSSAAGVAPDLSGGVEAGSEDNRRGGRPGDLPDPKAEQGAELPIGLAPAGMTEEPEARLRKDPQNVLCTALGLVAQSQRAHAEPREARCVTGGKAGFDVGASVEVCARHRVLGAGEAAVIATRDFHSDLPAWLIDDAL